MKPPASIRPAKDRSTLNSFIYYLKDYFRIVPLKSLLFTILFVAVLVTINYTSGIEKRILAIRPWYFSLSVFFLFYGSVLATAWGIQYRWGRPAQHPADLPPHQSVKGNDADRKWILLLALAPLYFAFKMIHWNFLPLLPSGWLLPWDHYALIVLQLPAKLLLLLALIYGCWKMGVWGRTDQDEKEPANLRKAIGLTRQGFNPRPYFLLLLFLTPLIALASTQHDFLRFYPKVKNLAFINAYAHPAWPWKLLYELSYGLDFLSIELFFRGFLVIGLARWAGPKAILPMAAFYCTVHFGKPLAECISSFFGGLALGVIAWRTRSILGGLMVHLGLAWMMEVGGWLGGR